ncbi:chemotaxis protein CheW [Sporosarcina pasteurii]|uniref:Coupling protein CheW n=1 Tax=Sporosarcina pasteurii TaxID=1474 RepID=A0A380BPY5_SPOPA|nr:chemotaxis protein CheW [Sporosarcina pasteurii]MDS9471136.1 chemotaxis protein CheW [Sporosarcina pasteurii]QBQ05224.1 chemotaxis protein CheW [Sporosarcina pasteurii]SUJ05026.1 Coupling protein CheW [Sporosarcina pasteurii]
MDELKAVIVQCGNEEYAIPVDSIVSIERLEQVNPIPHLPDFVLGLMNIRGELVPIFDFEKILYDRSAKIQDETRVVVVQTGVLTIGLLVLDAKEIIDIPNNSLTDSALKVYSKTPYFTAVANLKARMITVVDPNVLAQTLSGMNEIGAYVEAKISEAK